MNTEINKKIWVDKIIDNLNVGKRSKKTIENYLSAIKRFLNYYDETTDISLFNESDIIEYIKNEFINKNMAANTYNMNICAIKLLYIVCFNITFNDRLLPRAKTTKRMPTTIEKKKFLEIINGEDRLKYKCWLLLGYCSGLRIDEVSKIKIQDINSVHHKLKVLGKRNKERYTILPDITIKFLRLYYKEVGMTKKKGYLFEGLSKKEHCSSNAIGNYFCLLKRKYNLDDNICFHSLRHSFATNFIKSGGDLFVLKSMLGHASISTTSIYVHIATNFNNLIGDNHD